MMGKRIEMSITILNRRDQGVKTMAMKNIDGKRNNCVISRKPFVFSPFSTRKCFTRQ